MSRPGKKGGGNNPAKQGSRGRNGTTTTTEVGIIKSESYSGVVPHPDLLRQFDEIVPNGAERIFAMAEAEQSARHAGQTTALSIEEKKVKGVNTGRILAFTLGICCAAGALYLFVNGFPIGGAALAAIPTTGIIVALIKGNS